MEKRSLKWHDINRVNGHLAFGIAEKVCLFKNNTLMVEFERGDDLTIFIMINYYKIIY